MRQLNLNTTDSSASSSSSSSLSSSASSNQQHHHYNTLPTPWLSHCLSYLSLRDVVLRVRAVSRHWCTASRTAESVTSCEWSQSIIDGKIDSTGCMSRGILDLHRCKTQQYEGLDKFVNLSTLKLGLLFCHEYGVQLPRNIRDLIVCGVDTDFWLHLRHSLPKLQRLEIVTCPDQQRATIGSWISEYETLTDIRLAVWTRDLATQLALLVPLPRLRALYLDIYHDEASQANIDSFDAMVDLIPQLTHLKKLSIFTHEASFSDATLAAAMEAEENDEEPVFVLMNAWLPFSLAKFRKYRIASKDEVQPHSSNTTAAVIPAATIDSITNPLCHLEELHLLSPNEFDSIPCAENPDFAALFGVQIHTLSLALGMSERGMHNHTEARLSLFFKLFPSSHVLRVLHLTLHPPASVEDLHESLRHLGQLTEFHLKVIDSYEDLDFDLPRDRSFIGLLQDILQNLRNLEVLDVAGTVDTDDFSNLYYDLYCRSEYRAESSLAPAPEPLTSLRIFRLHQKISKTHSLDETEFHLRLKNYWNALGSVFPNLVVFDWSLYFAHGRAPEITEEWTEVDREDSRDTNLDAEEEYDVPRGRFPFPSVRHMKLHVDCHVVYSRVYYVLVERSLLLRAIMKDSVRNLPKMETLEVTCEVIADLLALLPDEEQNAIAPKGQTKSKKKMEKLKLALPHAPTPVPSLRHLIIGKTQQASKKQRKVDRDAEFLAKFTQRGVIVTQERNSPKDFATWN